MLTNMCLFGSLFFPLKRTDISLVDRVTGGKIKQVIINLKSTVLMFYSVKRPRLNKAFLIILIIYLFIYF